MWSVAAILHSMAMKQFHRCRTFYRSMLPWILFISDIWTVTDRVAQETDSEAEICVQEIDWGVVLGANLEGRREVGLEQGKLNCEASVFPRGSPESGIALQKYLELRQGGQASVPLF